MLWSETDSEAFIDYGRYFVPRRAEQIAVISRLLTAGEASLRILELCCGEGLLAEAILEQLPAATVLGCDGSTRMLNRAGKRLARFGARFRARGFDLAAAEWRRPDEPYDAVVSSLAIHHLDAGEKQALYRDVHGMLRPGGRFIVADIVQPVTLEAVEAAAAAWDAAVMVQSLQLAGSLEPYHFFEREQWNLFRHPDPMDKPSPLHDQLNWLIDSGFAAADVMWLQAGHAIFYGVRR